MTTGQAWPGAVDQFRIPWCSAVGVAAETVLSAEEFTAWAEARGRVCGHIAAHSEECRQCQGTLTVLEAFSGGSEHVRVYPRGR